MVDADESLNSALTEYFSDIARLFAAVKSAEEALPLLEGPMWDIVVCNLKLPGINGLEFSKLVSRQRPGTKIILATQHLNQSLKEKAADHGIVEIISAPLNSENLIYSLIHVSNRRHFGPSMIRLLDSTCDLG